MILLANAQHGVRRRRRAFSPTRLPGRARRRRQFALAQHPGRSEWARAFRRGADLAKKIGFREVFDGDDGTHDLFFATN